MRQFLRKYRRLHLWLLGLAVFFLLYFSLRQWKTLMNFLCGKVIFPMEHAIASLCSHTTVSVAEVLIITAICILLMFLACEIRIFFSQKGKRRETAYRTMMILLCAGMSIYAGFCLLWGNSYHMDSFQDQSGIEARGGSIEELTELTQYFADELALCSENVQRDEDGIFTSSVSAILDQSVLVYDTLYQEFPFLEGTVYPPKAVTCSYAMSKLDFTGFYFPFTGESNVNVDSPIVYLPVTAAHEIAHQKGISSEQECNFLAILASTRSDDSDYQYSGWLEGYVYLANALYRVAPEQWKEVYATLPENVVRDLRYNSAYWAEMKGTVQTVSNKVYDSFLKSNGDQNGILSYGTVVNLLLAYYVK